MPWVPEDATRFTKKARTQAEKESWAAIANTVLEKTHDEGKAIRIANGRFDQKKGKK